MWDLVFEEGRYKATWKSEFKLPWRKAGLLISMFKWTRTSTEGGGLVSQKEEQALFRELERVQGDAFWRGGSGGGGACPSPSMEMEREPERGGSGEVEAGPICRPEAGPSFRAEAGPSVCRC